MNTYKELQEYKLFLNEYGGNQERHQQSELLFDCLNKYFNFDKVICIETGASQDKNDGCFGLYLGKIVESTNGEFYSVDNNQETIINCNTFYNQFLPKISVKNVLADSITYLTNFEGSPNLVHLDSWDLDLKNPVPSMLHGWLEFQAIKDKMPSGSIIAIDDNYLKGTWVEWNCFVDGELHQEKIDITYDIVGKGSLVYHYCQNYISDWKIIGNHYLCGSKIKIIIQKK